MCAPADLGVSIQVRKRWSLFNRFVEAVKDEARDSAQPVSIVVAEFEARRNTAGKSVSRFVEELEARNKKKQRFKPRMHQLDAPVAA